MAPNRAGGDRHELSRAEQRKLVQEEEKAAGWELWRPVLQSSAVVGFTAIPLTFVSTQFFVEYGLVLFVFVPMLLGFVGELILEWRRPYRLASSVAVACLSVLITTVGLMLNRAEGLICLTMALPITMGLGIVGAGFGRHVSRYARKVRRNVFLSAAVLLPFAMVVEARSTAFPPVEVVSTEVVVAAPPERIWPLLSNLSLGEATDDPLFRAGIAYPVSIRTEGAGGPGAARVCELSTGEMPERIVAWEPNRRLRFRVLSTPISMQEYNPFGPVRAAHLRGYFQCREGEFELVPLPDGSTLLRGTSWYSNAMYPSAYWRLWTDSIVRRVHSRVMSEIKKRAEVK